LKIKTLLFLAFFLAPALTFAEVPQEILYEGRILNSAGNPEQNSITIRFSFWSQGDFLPTDRNENFALNTAAEHFSGWQETHEITPQEQGFFTTSLGSVNPLPEMNANTISFLQIEIKKSSEADTAYQLLDPTGDNGSDTHDRKRIGSVPYALSSQKASESTASTFLIDPNNTAENGEIRLQFGKTLEKHLSYNISEEQFLLNDSLHIAGNLTLEGSVNGYDMTLFIDENTAQILENKDIDAEKNTIHNLTKEHFLPQEKSIFLVPDYPQISIVPDGDNNRVSIYRGNDETENIPYYALSSKSETLQNMGFQIDFQLPDDFRSFQGIPFQILLRTEEEDILNNFLHVQVINKDHQEILLQDTNALTSHPAANWETKDILFDGAPEFHAGDRITLILTPSSRLQKRISLGQISIHYVGI